MRLPWVSRELYDTLARISGAAIADIGKLLGNEQTRYDALLEKYHALKLQGAEPLPPMGSLVYGPRTPDPDAEFKVLIAEQAGTDLRQRAVMLRQLRQDRLDGVSPEEIRRAIERGVQSDGVPT
jgi:hypothetical protein